MGWLVYLSLGLVSAALVSASGETPWSPETYPNPMVDVTKCGRGVASWVCDPDRILSTESANVVEGLLKKIQSGSPPYVLAPCGSAGMKGFQVAVALARHMQQSPDPAAYAERFAKSLHDKWGVGDAECDNGVVFFLSTSDRQLFISSGAGTGKLLSYDVLGEIIADVRPALKAQRYDDAVERAVVDIGLALAGRPVEPAEGGSGSGWDDWVAFGLFASTAGGLAWWAARTDSRKRRRYQDCKSKLEKLKRDQAAMRGATTYNPTSCPVCLEDFAEPAEGAGGGAGAGAAGAPGSPAAAEVVAAAAAAEDGGGLGLGRAAAGFSGISSSGAGAETETELRQPLNPAASGQGPVAGAAAAAAVAAGPGAVQPPRRPLVLPCGHSFCEQCISAWLDQKKLTCPICRRPIDDDDPPPPDPRDPPSSTTAPRPPRPADPNARAPPAASTPGAGPSSSSGPRPPCTVDDDADGAGDSYGGGSSTMYGGGGSTMYGGGSAAAAEADAQAAGGSAPRLRLRWPGSGYGRRGRGVRMGEEMLLAEMLFRLRQLQRQHPDYISGGMLSAWEQDLRSGREFSAQQLRDFQLQDPATRARLAASGSSGSGVRFGGGSSRGGGGRGGSW